MKIVFASYVYTPEFNTPEAWLRRINFYVCIQEALAVNHTIISIEQINYEGEYLQNGIQFQFKRLSKWGRYFPFKLHRYIKSLNPDIVFIHGLHFSSQIIQLRLLLGSKIKVIAQHHAEQPHTGIKKRIQKLADRCINAYLFASRDMGMEWVIRGNLASPNKIHGVMEVSSVFSPIDKALAQAITGISGAPIFLWVGRLNQNKDPLNVVRVFLNFVKINTSARLYMIYQTEELLSEIIELLDNNPTLRDAIVLVGKTPHADLLYWFNGADFIISGSFYEGSSAVICEAMSCGVIPIVTDILSFRMMTDNGKCGHLYEAGNQQALLTTLLKTIGMNMAQQREFTLKHYKETLSSEAIAARIEAVALSL
ncbi:MAG: glycosyltransferase family 4 protein [Mucilaginibacter sp.]|uniref:glycosyltransferase family 4 protein n=1 Tax=Mucilaginibacter sp. TaxID=1882438 RepID=UPI003267FCC5